MKNERTSKRCGRRPGESARKTRTKKRRTSEERVSERDRDFLRECVRLRSSPQGKSLSSREVAQMASMSRAPGWYLSFEYAMRILKQEGGGERKGTTARMRNDWLTRRVGELQKKRNMKRSTALSMVLEERAPSYFMNSWTAERLYYKFLNKEKGGNRE